MEKVGLVFPHQLFEDTGWLQGITKIYLVEEYLFFKQYAFHKQKLAFHRASMKFYASFLLSKGFELRYIESHEVIADIRELIPHLFSEGARSIIYMDTVDFYLEERIRKGASNYSIDLTKIQSASFINTEREIIEYFASKKKFYQTDFYKNQRQKLNILIDENQKPEGGQWTYDVDNRLRYPKGKTPPKVVFEKENAFQFEAKEYMETYFKANYGKLNREYLFPIDFESSKKWLQDFFENRFLDFGKYEDAILKNESFLHHSMLTPMLNVGLLTPTYIIDEALSFASKNDIPLNSLEGFIRQIIGWREFIRSVYQLKSVEERTKNHWKFTRKIPESFWNGTTGIEPIDDTIKKILETGYCHHIERLMVLGNFMMLCEFDPDEVYLWFMTLFIDAYDWVMVPNVYGMSQFADGGIFATKPYISGSNYILKMSDYKKGEWSEIWDALFWRFMDKQRNFFLQNPRLGMLIRTFDKMDQNKKNGYWATAEAFLKKLE
ncbi:cryptochrome/photolyase family protein [Lacihabitans sp. LS3-19]|nr:cryptochrome/photolyase family protein [Lacihabitans sp. LS3-19]